jgi:hypothetical protein
LNYTLVLFLGSLAISVSSARWVAASSADVSGATKEVPAVQGTSATTAESEALKAFGLKSGTPVDAGFVFMEGAYLDAPYTVSRRGGDIYINDTKIGTFASWSSVPLDDNDPGIPPGLTKDSTFDDLKVKDGSHDTWNARKIRWIERHYQGDDVGRMSVEYYKSLPFVKNSWLEGKDVIKVETWAGKVVMFVMLAPRTPPTKEDVLWQLETDRARFEERLKKGDCFFLFPRRQELSFSRIKVAKDLPVALEILRSDRSKEEKLSLLERLALIPEPQKDGKPNFFDSLVTGFKTTPQLDARLQKVVAETGITPRKLDEIPAESAISIERRRFDERMKQKGAASPTATAAGNSL